ncbi:MAG: adenylate/guanylate cyclase domain-containing protein [Rhodospirillales bacterium]
MFDADHAANGVIAAMECNNRLHDASDNFGLSGQQRIAARFGINTGEMLVGNIGSKRRFNYAAMGDAANLGSRLEGANKFYGTTILVGERSVELCGGKIEFREIDLVQVVGRANPVAIFEPLAEAGALGDDQRRLRDGFAAALALYRAANFRDAAAAFEALAGEDTVSEKFARRSHAFAENPPPDDWGGVYILESK